MTTASETVVSLKLETTPRRQHHGHRRYHLLMRATRILLGAAIVLGLFSISHFAYKAFNATSCYTETTDDRGSSRRTPVQSPECAAMLASTDEQMRVDASIALVGVAFLLSSAMCYRKARKYRPRGYSTSPRELSVFRNIFSRSK